MTDWEYSDSVTATTLGVGLIVEADYTTPPLIIPTDWVDLSPFRSVSIRQGRQRLLDRTEVGQASVALDNRERDFDPTLHPEVRPGNHLRIRAMLDGNPVDLFRGFVRSWPQEWPGGGFDAVSTVQAEDAFALMARFALEGDAITSLASGAHIREVLTRYGWPEAGEIPPGTTWWILGDAASQLGTNTFLGESLSQIDDGTATIMATNLEGNMLDHLLNVAESTEGGTLYIGPAGDVVFHEHQVAATPPVGTWGDLAGENRYTDLLVVYDDSQIYNDIRLTRRGDATVASATDADAIDAYGPRTLEISDLLHSTQGAAESRADELLFKHKDATLYPQQLVMRPKPDSNVWPLILGIPLGTTLVVRRRPPGGGAMIELTCQVIGVTYEITPDLWETTWDLATALEVVTQWLLGTAGSSELGVTTGLG